MDRWYNQETAIRRSHRSMTSLVRDRRLWLSEREPAAVYGYSSLEKDRIRLEMEERDL